MNLYLIGHDYRYAAEQMLLTLFPDERPVYPDGRPTGDRAELRLMSGAKVTTATCVLVYQGRTANGRTSVPNEELTDPNETDRRLQGAVKRAFYRAAMGIGLPHRPWGMLTGVRPGKLMTPLLAQGMGDVQAARYFERHYDVAPARAALVVRTAHATLRAMDSLGEKDVCLYVGIPFCPTRCAYCSFVSQSVEKSMALVPEFLQALAREIAATAEAVHRAGLRVVSLYIGGGTPTTLSAPCASSPSRPAGPTPSRPTSCTCCARTGSTASASTRRRSTTACSKRSAAATRRRTSMTRCSSCARPAALP